MFQFTDASRMGAGCSKWTMNLSATCGDLLFGRGDFRGPGDQACAAKRSYSAWTALCFFEEASLRGGRHAGVGKLPSATYEFPRAVHEGFPGLPAVACIDRE